MIAYIPHGKCNSITNGQLLEITNATDPVTFRDIETGDEVQLNIEWVRKNMRLAYAFTNVGCQGRPLGNFADGETPERGVTVWDTNSQYFNLKHLFTGTSRSRSGIYLQVM